MVIKLKTQWFLLWLPFHIIFIFASINFAKLSLRNRAVRMVVFLFLSSFCLLMIPYMIVELLYETQTINTMIVFPIYSLVISIIINILVILYQKKVYEKAMGLIDPLANVRSEDNGSTGNQPDNSDQISFDEQAHIQDDAVQKKAETPPRSDVRISIPVGPQWFFVWLPFHILCIVAAINFGVAGMMKKTMWMIAALIIAHFGLLVLPDFILSQTFGPDYAFEKFLFPWSVYIIGSALVILYQHFVFRKQGVKNQ